MPSFTPMSMRPQAVRRVGDQGVGRSARQGPWSGGIEGRAPARRSASAASRDLGVVARHGLEGDADFVHHAARRRQGARHGRRRGRFFATRSTFARSGRGCRRSRSSTSIVGAAGAQPVFAGDRRRATSSSSRVVGHRIAPRDEIGGGAAPPRRGSVLHVRAARPPGVRDQSPRRAPGGGKRLAIGRAIDAGVVLRSPRREKSMKVPTTMTDPPCRPAPPDDGGRDRRRVAGAGGCRRICRRPPKGRTTVGGRQPARRRRRWRMAVERHWPGDLSGVVVTRYGHGGRDRPDRRGGGRPPGAPDAAGRQAARRILDTVRGLGEDDTGAL